MCCHERFDREEKYADLVQGTRHFRNQLVGGARAFPLQ
jgi:hypothetical protein